ncbi:MAG: aldose 1-epimerase [Rhizobium sp.]
MSVIELKNGALALRVSTAGGLILGYWWNKGAETVPLLRPAPNDEADALSSGCYPLVPFGNRVKNNRFTFDGRSYGFSANTQWDPHYLHGEGWNSEWSVERQSGNELELGLVHRGGHTPYEYRTYQRFLLRENELEMELGVENLGEHSLPFGLGWHPYFPMTPQTTLTAPARRFWTEVDGWLPGKAETIPDDLNFREPSPLPHRWVNNGFEGWDGEALICWPERGTALRLVADPVFRHAFIFVSDTDFDPGFQRDYFCFEPMSHLANGHNLPDLGDLKVRKPGDRLSGRIRLRPQAI